MHIQHYVFLLIVAIPLFFDFFILVLSTALAVIAYIAYDYVRRSKEEGNWWPS